MQIKAEQEIGAKAYSSTSSADSDATTQRCAESGGSGAFTRVDTRLHMALPPGARSPVRTGTAMPPRKPKAPPVPQTGERLQKYMARCGIASRRAAEELITQARVEVNGQVVTQLGTRVEEGEDDVRLDGERLAPMRQQVVLLLNKPVGYLCSASDPESRPLIYKLVPSALNLRSIGRLDFNTEGVLLLTNDGELAERLGHARYSVQRVYEARVRGVPSDQTLAQLVRGVRLEDGPARAETAQLIKQTENNAWVRLTLAEGRYREVRRMLESVGHPVVRLRRVAYAGLTALGLKPGQWRMLAEAEIAQLRQKGHVGSFELPPDPRRKGQDLEERPKISQRGSRGAARTATSEPSYEGLATSRHADSPAPPPPKPRPRATGPARSKDAARPAAGRPARGRPQASEPPPARRPSSRPGARKPGGSRPDRSR
jgi:23S rRNA pseudouridine2605 synthase